MLTLIANVLGACGLSKLATRGREGRFREIHTFAARIEIRPIFELSRVPVATPRWEVSFSKVVLAIGYQSNRVRCSRPPCRGVFPSIFSRRLDQES